MNIFIICVSFLLGFYSGWSPIVGPVNVPVQVLLVICSIVFVIGLISGRIFQQSKKNSVKYYSFIFAFTYCLGFWPGSIVKILIGYDMKSQLETSFSWIFISFSIGCFASALVARKNKEQAE